MSHQRDQLQALIAEIDSVLSKPSPRLPWVATIETTQQRMILEKVRKYLVSLDQSFNQGLDQTTRQFGQLAGISASELISGTDLGQQSQSMARQIWQALVQEMSAVKTDLTGPLQQEINGLQQERQNLIRDIQQLEARLQQLQSFAQQQANQQQVISEFLQVLTNRLQESLSQYVNQAIASLETRFLGNLVLTEPASRELTVNDAETMAVVRPLLQATAELTLAQQPTEPALLSPSQRLETLQTVQAQSDRLLMTLDQTINDMFETLQKNLHTYQDSLSVGLERMHNLGQQGEVMFTALVSHLVEQLDEMANYATKSIAESKDVAPSRQGPSSPPRPTRGQVPVVYPQEGQPIITATQWPKIDEETDVDTLRLPYAGTELSDKTAEKLPVKEQINAVKSPPIIAEQVVDVKDEIEDLSASLFDQEEISLSVSSDVEVKGRQIPDQEEEFRDSIDLHIDEDLPAEQVILPDGEDEIINDNFLLEAEESLPSVTPTETNTTVVSGPLKVVTIDNFLPDENTSTNKTVEKQSNSTDDDYVYISTTYSDDDLGEIDLEEVGDFLQASEEFNPIKTGFTDEQEGQTSSQNNSSSSDVKEEDQLEMKMEIEDYSLEELSGLFTDELPATIPSIELEPKTEPESQKKTTATQKSSKKSPPEKQQNQPVTIQESPTKIQEDTVAQSSDFTVNSLADDLFEQASPDENLLPSNSSLTFKNELSLNQETIQQLQEDLLSLEGLEIPEEPVNSEVGDEYQNLSDITFSIAAPLAASEAVNQFSEVNNPSNNVEEFNSLDDFLADIFPAAGENIEVDNSNPSGMTLDDVFAVLTAAEELTNSPSMMR